MGPLGDESKLQVDEKNKKTEKFEKSLKMYNIINFETIRYKWLPRNLNPWILNYMLLRPVSILRLKNRPKPLTRKKIEREKSLKNNFLVMTFLSSINHLSAWDFFFTYDFKLWKNMNKYIRTTKFLRKPVVSTQLNSFAFNKKQ